jgi:nucleoid-associated protein YgaU
MSRYNKRVKATNKNELYDNTFEKRGVNEVVQYSTPILTDMSEDDKLRVAYIEHTWRSGDRYWNLSSKYYGDPRQWWVIAEFNNLPTEAGIEPGTVIKVPTDLAVILGEIG